jgi:ribosomal protein S18 acetylase RimI-like enzyme
MVVIRPMTIDDYPAVISLLQATPGVSVREADSFEATARYLARNPDLSFVAVDGDSIVGCVMSGHDGRRGYLQHLAVRPDYQRQGIGRRLAQACVEALGAGGIAKVHLFVFTTNDVGNAFWQHTGWQLRDDILMYSHNSSPNANA